MKQNLIMAGILIPTVFTLTSFSMREVPQNPQEKRTKKHIVLEKIDDKGNKVSLDTIIENDNVFVWNGDTIGGKTETKWFAGDGKNIDSILKTIDLNYEYEINDDTEGNVFIIKSDKGGKQVLHEFVTEDDSGKTIRVHVQTDDLAGNQDVMIWNDREGNNIFPTPHVTSLPHLPNTPFIAQTQRISHANVIDLSEQGIISYKKKKKKDGTEKITIIRKQVDEKMLEHVENFMLAPDQNNQNIIFDGNPEHVKRIKIIKEDGKENEIEIEENIEKN